jgi:hypothetical protein
MSLALQSKPQFDAALSERRGSSRRDCCLDALCHSGMIFWWPASVMTFSSGGAGIVLGAPAERGTQLTLTLRTGPRTSRDFLGRVVHCRRFGEAWRVGVAFDVLLSDRDTADLCYG